MDFARLCGFSTSTLVRDNYVIKYYHGISDFHWERIRYASGKLSRARIGPGIITVVDNDQQKAIMYERVDLLEPTKCDDRDQLIDSINKTISKLHSLGYAHGDLHIENIGIKRGEIYLLDHDTVYETSKYLRSGLELEPWLKKWMDKGFDWEGTFEEFINYDYTAWRTDWLQ